MMVREQPHPTHIAGDLRGWAAQRKRSLALCLAGGATATALCARLFRRVQVAGESMRPAFEPGDRLLIGPPARIGPGSVVAIADTRYPDRLMVKRVRSLGPTWVDVRGDNEAASTDSRQLGLMPRSQLTGRVLYRYGPAGRTGWLPGHVRPTTTPAPSTIPPHAIGASDR
jgi:nickel-type superoxide dismutase maturation protease